MIAVYVSRAGDEPARRVVSEAAEVTIGSAEDAEVVLAGAERWHARILAGELRLIAAAPVRVDHREIAGSAVIDERAAIYIGDHVLRVERAAPDPDAELLAAVHRGDDASRLVYADRLEELGHLARARVLRDPESASCGGIAKVKVRVEAALGAAWPRPELDWCELVRLLEDGSAIPQGLVGWDGMWSPPIAAWFEHLVARHGPELGELLAMRVHVALAHDAHPMWRTPVEAGRVRDAVDATGPVSLDALLVWLRSVADDASASGAYRHERECAFCGGTIVHYACVIGDARQIMFGNRWPVAPRHRLAHVLGMARSVAARAPLHPTRIYRDIHDACIACHTVAGHRPDCTWLRAALLVAATTADR